MRVLVTESTQFTGILTMSGSRMESAPSVFCLRWQDRRIPQPSSASRVQNAMGILTLEPFLSNFYLRKVMHYCSLPKLIIGRRRDPSYEPCSAQKNRNGMNTNISLTQKQLSDFLLNVAPARPVFIW